MSGYSESVRQRNHNPETGRKSSSFGRKTVGNYPHLSSGALCTGGGRKQRSRAIKLQIDLAHRRDTLSRGFRAILLESLRFRRKRKTPPAGRIVAMRCSLFVKTGLRLLLLRCQVMRSQKFRAESGTERALFQTSFFCLSVS